MKSDLLPSGYLGVDIFFVISGFVITSSISKRKEKDFKNFISQKPTFIRKKTEEILY